MKTKYIKYLNIPKIQKKKMDWDLKFTGNQWNDSYGKLLNFEQETPIMI